MLYATCSVFDEENRAQVARFRAVHSDAISIPIHGRPYGTVRVVNPFAADGVHELPPLYA
jgi:16S rRNA C967 or C1407 C5-methylase (RsmB/RsmF family)